MSFLPLDAPAAQLVVTVGPASLGRAGELAKAGATAFRLNGSHLTPGELVNVVASIRKQVADCPVLIDLQGAKMRVGDFSPRSLRIGERITFHDGGGAVGEPDSLPLPHPELMQSVRPGETLSMDDDRLRLRVLEVGDGFLMAEALRAGTLSPRKGVNLMEHPVELQDLSKGDLAQLQAVAGTEKIAFAFSFMKSGAEAEWLRRRGATLVVGKVERDEACQNLTAISHQVNAIWICRGDLGAQLGSLGLARFVASLRPRALRVPVLMAGQVFQHLTHHAGPTRSEVCHLYDLLERGYAGIVLSDETAVGVDPVGATATASALLRELGARPDPESF